MVFIAKRERVKNPNYVAGSGDWKKNREYAEYTSASMNTSGKFVFKYGRLLCRAKFLLIWVHGQLFGLVETGGNGL